MYERLTPLTVMDRVPERTAGIPQPDCANVRFDEKM